MIYAMALNLKSKVGAWESDNETQYTLPHTQGILYILGILAGSLMEGGTLWAHSVLPSVSRAEPWWGLQKNMKKCDRKAFCDLYLQTIFLIISIVNYISVITYLSTPQLLCLLCLFYWIIESWIVWPIS